MFGHIIKETDFDLKKFQFVNCNNIFPRTICKVVFNKVSYISEERFQSDDGCLKDVKSCTFFFMTVLYGLLCLQQSSFFRKLVAGKFNC